MNIRNFKPINQNQINQHQINQHQNQMPMNFNAPGISGPPFNAMGGNMQSRNGNNWGAMPLFPQQLRQGNNNQPPMFHQGQGQGRGMRNGPPEPLFQNQNNGMPNREPLFNREPFNRGGMMAPESGVRLFNRSPERGPGLQLNRSPNRGPGLQLNRSPDRGVWLPFNRSPGREPELSFNRSPDRGMGLPVNCNPDRGMGHPVNCNPDRGMGHPVNCNPDRGMGHPVNCNPDRGMGHPVNCNPDRGMGHPVNCNPDRGSGQPDFNQKPDFLMNCSPNMRPGRQLNRNSELLPGYQFFNSKNEAPEREPPFLRGPGNRSPERMLDFHRRRLSRSPMRGARGRRRSRSRSAERGPRRGGGSPRRDISPRRDLRRVSPPFRQGRSPDSGKLHSSRPLPPMDERTVAELPGSRKKWFKRYKDKGFSHEEALLMAKEPIQPAANFRQGPQPPDLEPPMSFSNNRSDEDIRNSPQNDVSMNEPKTIERSSDPNELKVCLMPVGYPKESFSHQEKLDIEEAVLQEIVKAGSYAGAPLRFSSIQFKPGFLKMNCSNQATAEWLMGTARQLSSYIGRPVEPIFGNIIPPGQKISISVFLPRGAGQSDEYLLSLLKSQNQYNTDLWKLITRRDQGGGALVVLGIDKESAIDIAANNHSIFYRYGTVPVRGLKRFGNYPPTKSPNPDAKNCVKNPLSAKTSRGPKNISFNSKSPRGAKNPSRAESPQLKNCPVPEAEYLEDPELSPLCIDLASDDDNQ